MTEGPACPFAAATDDVVTDFCLLAVIDPHKLAPLRIAAARHKEILQAVLAAVMKKLERWNDGKPYIMKT